MLTNDKMNETDRISIVRFGRNSFASIQSKEKFGFLFDDDE